MRSPFLELDRHTLQEQVKYMISPKRYVHSEAVAELSEYWALLWREDKDRAYVAGLLHDIARELPADELLRRARLAGIPLDDELLASPVILHAGVGAAMASTELGVEDAPVLEAIAHHTIPSVEMSDLAKIIYLADICEPNRRWWPGREILLELCLLNLDQAMAYALDQTMSYLVEKGQRPYSHTLAVLEQYRSKLAAEPAAEKRALEDLPPAAALGRQQS